MSLPTQPPRAPLLYLREDELDAGIALIFDAARTLDSVARSVGGGLDLSGTDLRVMLVARRPGGIGVLALAAALGMTKQGIIRTLEQMEARGLLERKRDPKDGRGRLVTLTATGQELERQVSVMLRERLAAAYRKAGPDAVAGAHAVLRAVGTGGRTPARGVAA